MNYVDGLKNKVESVKDYISDNRIALLRPAIYTGVAGDILFFLMPSGSIGRAASLATGICTLGAVYLHRHHTNKIVEKYVNDFMEGTENMPHASKYAHIYNNMIEELGKNVPQRAGVLAKFERTVMPTSAEVILDELKGDRQRYMDLILYLDAMKISSRPSAAPFPCENSIEYNSAL